jgi:diaminopimelate epimerase
MMRMKKYHALGNDYLVYDPNKEDMALNRDRVVLICDRNLGVGSDGILFGPILEDNNITLKIFNPDGSEAEKSGNGIRIFAKYLYDEKYIKDNKFILRTLGGDANVEYLNASGDLIRVMMGRAVFSSSEIPVAGGNRYVINEHMTFNGTDYKVSCVSIGNPHCVIPMKEISKDLACKLGPIVTNSDMFPNKINMQLLKVLDKANIQIEIFERGAGYTLASGSSSCAAASVAYRLGFVDNKITVHMPGGQLDVLVQDDGEIFLTGTVCNVATVILDEQFTNRLKSL